MSTKVMNEEVCVLMDSWEAWILVRESNTDLDVDALEDCSPEDDDIFFLHQGSFYNLNEFMPFQDPNREECLLRFDGYSPWTYFSGICLKHLGEMEVEVGIYYNG